MLGTRERFARAMVEIESALRSTPTIWGDPSRHLNGMRMTQVRRIHDRILVYYAAHDVEPVVWLTAVEPLRKSAFGAGEGW
jgi:hypothetical protein